MELCQDLSQVEVWGSEEPLPAGKYHVKIISFESRESRIGNTYVSCQYKVIDGQYAGRTIYDNLNLWHRDPRVVGIARSQLKGICQAVGYPNPNYLKNTDDLVGCEMTVRLKLKEDRNSVANYLPIQEAVGTPVRVGGSTQENARNSAQSVPPPFPPVDVACGQQAAVNPWA